MGDSPAEAVWQLVEKWHAFKKPKFHYRTHKSRHRLLSWASWNQFIY